MLLNFKWKTIYYWILNERQSTTEFWMPDNLLLNLDQWTWNIKFWSIFCKYKTIRHYNVRNMRLRNRCILWIESMKSNCSYTLLCLLPFQCRPRGAVIIHLGIFLLLATSISPGSGRREEVVQWEQPIVWGQSVCCLTVKQKKDIKPLNWNKHTHFFSFSCKKQSTMFAKFSEWFEEDIRKDFQAWPMIHYTHFAMFLP